MPDSIHDPSRRQFIKLAGAGASWVGAGGWGLQSCMADRPSASAGRLYEVFTNPPNEARPFFRWWWNGNQVDMEEITRELEIIQRSGAGGVEINPIAMPEQAEHTADGLEWLSDKWCRMLVHAVKEANRLGLVTDLIVGTGWPFGGEFIDPEQTLQGITAEHMELQGARTATVHIPQPERNSHERMLSISLIPEGISQPESVRDLTEQVGENGDLTVDLPEGRFTLLILKWRNRFRTVFHGAPGGAGSVLDHFNAEAVRTYLQHMSDHIKPFFNDDMGSGIRSLFCDSIELAGANWTDDLGNEFRKRRGYALEPFLPLLYYNKTLENEDLRQMLRRIRYDYSLTLSELFLERFIKPYHLWCHENNTQSRYQAYGHPWLYTDMIDGFMVPDIPEGDQWLFNPGWSPARIDEIRYAIWNKYASSGGHLSGKTIISSEAMTNTSGVFRASLEYIKQAADLNFVAGINHLVLHGFNYSPPEAGFPGWVRYGCYFSEYNPWWKHFPKWSAYASRLSAVFQISRPVVQLAILGPTADVWSDHGLDRNPFNLTPWYLHAFWQALNHNGICADYINSSILRNAGVTEGKLVFGPMTYKTLVLCNVDTIEPDVLQRICDLSSAGLNVVCIGKKPSRAPGWMNSLERDQLVQTLSLELFDGGANFVEDPPQESIGPHQGLSDWTKRLIDSCQVEKGISMEPNDAGLFYMQRQYEATDLFFFANSQREKSLKVQLNLRINNKEVWHWCPETLNRTMIHKDAGKPFELNLSPLASALLVLTPALQEKSIAKGSLQGPPPFPLTGIWKVAGEHHIEDSGFEIELEDLYDLSTREDLKDFSGEITYSLEFDLNETDYKVIDPGAVFDTAEIHINGTCIGTRWWGKDPVIIPEGTLKQEGNLLVVKVSNRLFNYCASLKDNPTAEHWISRNRHQTGLPTGMIGPVVLR